MAAKTSLGKEWEFLAHCTATPLVVRYASADVQGVQEVQEVGMLVRYRCRWVSPRGQAGPWSNTVAALVNH
jgi:hypothetical protein